MKHILAVLVFMLSIGIAYAGHLNVTLDDLLSLAESGVSDKTILAFIEPREITFTLGTEEIAKLRKAGFSEEVIQYLLAKSRQASLTYNQYIKPPVPYSYPGYYYGPSLYLGFGGGHHAFFDHHFVGLHHAHHAAPHHVGRHHAHHAAPHHIAHSGHKSGHHSGHTSHFTVGSGSTHTIGRSSHNASGSRTHTAGRNSSHGSSRSHSVIAGSHHTSASRAHSTNRRSSHSSSHRGGHGGRSHGSGHGRGHSGH